MSEVTHMSHPDQPDLLAILSRALTVNKCRPRERAHLVLGAEPWARCGPA